MNVVTKPLFSNQHNIQEALCIWYLVCDGNNAYHGALDGDFLGQAVLSEALIPSIRKVACMIAASRHDFRHRSPCQFTDESDWFAARILVLKARFFHLDVTLLDMLAVANDRAKTFAKKYGLSFIPATACLSLYAGRPDTMLIMATPLNVEQDKMANSLVENSQRLNKLVCDFKFL